MRGDITTPWAGRSKEYSWSLCADLAPRNITPTDIDYVVECKGKFAFFEMKTAGSNMPNGQERMFDSLLLGLGGNAILFVVEHTELARVSMPIDVVRFHCRMMNKHAEISKSKVYNGVAFPMVYTGFFDWAESRKKLKDAFEAADRHSDWIADYEREEARQRSAEPHSS